MVNLVFGWGGLAEDTRLSGCRVWTPEGLSSVTTHPAMPRARSPQSPPSAVRAS